MPLNPPINPTPLAELSPAPSMQDPENFPERGDVHVAEVVQLVPRLNEELQKVFANASTAYQGGLRAEAAQGLTAYKGPWAAQAGAMAIPATVTHAPADTLYMLLEGVADVAAHEPGVSNKWKSLAPIAPRTPVLSVLTASGPYTVPDGVFTIRGYAIGKGGNGGATFGANATNSNGGGGGGMAFGDIAVTPGQVLQITIAAGVAKLSVGGVDYLVGNPGGNGGAAGGAGGTATKHANVTNGGAYSGGLGGTGANAGNGGFGGGSAASPLGNGFPGAVSPGHAASSGAGIGGGVGAYGGGGGAGGGGVSYLGGGAGGAATANTPGPGRSLNAAYTDPILRHMVCSGGWAYDNNGANAPGPGGGGARTAYRGGNGGDGGGGGAASGSVSEVRGGDGGFLGGGGGAVNTTTSANFWAYGGNGGIGGGGGGAHAAHTGANYATAGTGGPAAVLIYA